LVTVEKIREIYFIDTVKFHLDTVSDLGYFVEIEAIDYQGILGKKNYLSSVIIIVIYWVFETKISLMLHTVIYY